MNITVVYYDKGTPKEELSSIAQSIVDVVEDTSVIALPKEFDLLLNCSADQLLHIRSIIDAALTFKLQGQTMNQELRPDDVSIEDPESKIIDITKYLH